MTYSLALIWPCAITGLPLASTGAAPSMRRRQQLTVRYRVGPSVHSPERLSGWRELHAIRKHSTSSPADVCRLRGSEITVPTTVVFSRQQTFYFGVTPNTAPTSTDARRAPRRAAIYTRISLNATGKGLDVARQEEGRSQAHRRSGMAGNGGVLR